MPSQSYTRVVTYIVHDRQLIPRKFYWVGRLPLTDCRISLPRWRS